MSLEESIAELTKALNRNSDLLEGLTAKAKGSVSAKEAASDEKPASTRGKAKEEEKAPRGRGRAAKAPSAAEMKAAGEKFVDVTDDDEYAERRKLLRAIVDYFKTEKFTTIEEGDRALALQLLELAKAGDLDPDDVQAGVDSLSGEEEKDDEKPSRGRGRRSDDV